MGDTNKEIKSLKNIVTKYTVWILSWISFVSESKSVGTYYISNILRCHCFMYCSIYINTAFLSDAELLLSSSL